MAPQKLSEANKQDIVTLYRETAETSASLAGRFGVSTSTIGRILRQGLPASEYDQLVQQKRAAGKAASTSTASASSEATAPPATTEQATMENGAVTPPRKKVTEASPKSHSTTATAEAEADSADKIDVDALDDIASSITATDSELVTAEATDAPAADQATDKKPSRRSRRRKSVVEEEDAAVKPVLAELEELEKEIQQDLQYAALEVDDETDLDDDLDEEEDDIDDDLDAEAGLDDDFDDEDLDEEEDEGSESDEDFVPVHLRGDQQIQILPLTEAKLPRTCYLVVDRMAELITRPLSDFADLGQIPDVEAKERTLPVFDNHRIAKRFMRRAQRIVKIPDSQMFFKTRPYLQAKGITRLLVDGQIYTLEGADNA